MWLRVLFATLSKTTCAVVEALQVSGLQIRVVDHCPVRERLCRVQLCPRHFWSAACQITWVAWKNTVFLVAVSEMSAVTSCKLCMHLSFHFILQRHCTVMMYKALLASTFMRHFLFYCGITSCYYSNIFFSFTERQKIPSRIIFAVTLFT